MCLTNIGKSQPKNAAKAKPKSAATDKKTNKAAAPAAGKAAGRGRANRRGGNAGRPKAKTAEELDQEMADYFDGGNPNGETAVAGGAVQAPSGEAAMTDEIM
jgi:THO complex subunit 4